MNGKIVTIDEDDEEEWLQTRYKDRKGELVDGHHI